MLWPFLLLVCIDLDDSQIQPRRARDSVSVVFAGGTDFAFLFRKTDANVGADESLHVVTCVRRDQSVFDEPDGDSQVGADDQLTLASVAIHAAVDINGDHLCVGCVDLLNGDAVVFTQCTLKPRAQQTIHYHVRPIQTTGRKRCNSGQTVAPLQLSGENSNFLSAKKEIVPNPKILELFWWR